MKDGHRIRLVLRILGFVGAFVVCVVVISPVNGESAGASSRPASRVPPEYSNLTIRGPAVVEFTGDGIGTGIRTVGAGPYPKATIISTPTLRGHLNYDVFVLPQSARGPSTAADAAALSFRKRAIWDYADAENRGKDASMIAGFTRVVTWRLNTSAGKHVARGGYSLYVIGSVRGHPAFFAEADYEVAS